MTDPNRTQYFNAQPAPLDGDLWLICGDWTRHRKPDFSSESWTSLDDLLSLNECDAIDEMARAIARRWYVVDDNDISLFDGVSLGKLLELELRFQPILPCLKVITALNCLHTSYPNLERLVIVDQLFDVTAEGIRERRKIGEPIQVVYYSRSLIDAQISALRVYASVHEMDFISTITPAIEPVAGIRGVMMPAPWRRRFVNAVICTINDAMARLFDIIQKRKSAPRILISTYKVTANFMRYWQTQDRSPFNLAIPRDGRPPFRLLLALGQKGAITVKCSPRLLLRGSQKRDLAMCLKNAVRATNSIEFQSLCLVGSVPLGVVLTDSILATLDRDVPLVAHRLSTIITEFRRHKIAAVVTPFDLPLLDRMLICVAQSHHVPSYTVQHGHMTSMAAIGEGMLVDNLLVWSERWRQPYIDGGHDSRMIFVIGNPNLDDGNLQRLLPRRQPGSTIRHVLVLTDPRSWLLASMVEDGNDSYVMSVLDALSRVDDTLVVTVKLHPSEKLEVYNPLAHNPRFAHWTFVKGPIEHYFAETDLVIGPDSTAMFEAMIAGLPVVVMNTQKAQFMFPFDGNAIVPVARTSEQLEKIVRTLINGELVLPSKDMRTIASDVIGSLDGHSSRRLYEFLTTVVRPLT